MKPWLLHSLIALVLWGVWGFWGRLASRSVTPRNLLLLGSIGGLLVFPVFLAVFYRYLTFNWRQIDCYHALLGGVAGAIGGLFFYWAISTGEASRVVTITAMYPVVTVLLAWAFLAEPLTFSKLTGLIFAVPGVCLLAR